MAANPIKRNIPNNKMLADYNIDKGVISRITILYPEVMEMGEAPLRSNQLSKKKFHRELSRSIPLPMSFPGDIEWM
jgi:hypothetical protein